MLQNIPMDFNEGCDYPKKVEKWIPLDKFKKLFCKKRIWCPQGDLQGWD